MITPITEISSILGAPQTGRTTARVGDPVDSMFGHMFRSAIQNVRTTDAERVETEYLLATGQLDNPFAMNIAIEKNLTAVNMLIQLRNKSLDAYSELTRINL